MTVGNKRAGAAGKPKSGETDADRRNRALGNLRPVEPSRRGRSP
jgi:hypothetical protein